MDPRQQRRAARFKARHFAADCHAARLEALFARQACDRAATRARIRDALRHQAAKEHRTGQPKVHDDGPASRPPSVRPSPARPPPVALPEWLIDIPSNLADKWLVLPRPDGKRVFVVASAGRTVVRSRDGRVVRFGDAVSRSRRRRKGEANHSPPFAVSALPGGRPGSRGTTVLDCVFADGAGTPSAKTKSRAVVPRGRDGGVCVTLWVLDVMVWNERYLDDCSVDFRFFWVRSALAELDDNDDGEGEGEGEDEDEGEGEVKFSMAQIEEDDEMEWKEEGDEEEKAQGRGPPWLNFRPVPYYPADESGIEAAADVGTNARRGIRPQDGLLFYARDAQVELRRTPAVLAWKDAATSSHAIETFPEPPPPNLPSHELPLVATLAHDASDGGAGVHGDVTILRTSDAESVAVAEVPVAELAALGMDWMRRLVRVRVTNCQMVADGAAPEVELIGLAGQGRRSADCWSRIMFQCLVRFRPVTLLGQPAESAPIIET